MKIERNSTIQRWTLGIATVLVLVASFFLWQVHTATTLELQKREHAIELSHASYGLLNPVTWIEEAGKYLETRIDTWELTEEQTSEWALILKNEALEPMDIFFRDEVIEKGVPRLLDGFEGSRLFRGLLGSNLGSTVKAAVKNAYEDIIRPGLGAVVEEMGSKVTLKIGEWLNRPETKAWLKEGLRQQVKILKSQSGLMEENSPALAVQRRYGCKEGLEAETRRTCVVAIQKEAIIDRAEARQGSLIVAVVTGVVVLWALFLSAGHGILPLFGTLVLLWLAGITLPMLSVEARIGELDILVGGAALNFQDNVLFYQSKSILEFVRILIAGGKSQTIIVGILIGLFSVLFPLVKLVGMAWMSIRGRGRTPNWVRAVVLHTGKWSMADVFVVALFMAYLGFGRMIQSQIDGIGKGSASVRAVATDGTQLEYGFFFFLAFCVVSIASTRLFKAETEEMGDAS